MPLLYERFERLEQHYKDISLDTESLLAADAHYPVEGTGLGLSIVQRIMTHMDWQLTHQVNPLGGSTFIINYH